MLEYIEHIIVPYETTRDLLHDVKPSLAIIDNFKGQITAVNALLYSRNIHVCLLPPNTTDLQPMNVSINKPAKDFLKQEFVCRRGDAATRRILTQ